MLGRGLSSNISVVLRCSPTTVGMLVQSSRAITTRSHSSLPPKQDPAAQVEFCVGKIQEVELHPNADSLYVSKVDISNNGTDYLTVCSGLVKYLNRDQLLGRLVVIVSNLKSAKLRGVKSEAMLLAAQEESKSEANENKNNIIDYQSRLELVEPPANSPVGEKLYFHGIEPQIKGKIKPKTWQLVQPKLQIMPSGIVSYDGKHDLQNSNGDKAIVPNIRCGTVS